MKIKEVFNMVQRNINFYERKKKLLQKHEFCTKGKVHIMNFWWRKSWHYRFLGLKGIFFNASGSWKDLSLVFTELAWYFKNRDRCSFSSQKNDKMIFSLACNTMFTDYWKVLVLNFPEIGNTVFFELKSSWKDDIFWSQ